MTWSDDDKADFRTKYLALNIGGNPEVDSHRMPWETDPDEEVG